MTENTSPRKRHKNDERTVYCPVEECHKEVLARGVHLHVRQSAGNGHGEQGDIPVGLDFENLETAGEREVSMDYPERRNVEKVARLCPYCEKPFRGKEGVLIHLGQVRGRNSEHPEDCLENVDPDEFTIVRVDEHNNVLDTVEEGEVLPSTERRQAAEEVDDLAERVEKYITMLRKTGREEAAEEAEKTLLDD